MMELRDKSVLVLGLGETGLSLVRWLATQGARVRAADSRNLPPTFAILRVEFPQMDIRCGAFGDELFSDIDLIAISPGIPLSDPYVTRAIEQGIPVVGDMELFAWHLAACSNKPRILAITGSNGKTTVTSMVGAMCRAAGLDTEIAGNVSPAVLDVLMQRKDRQPDVWVLELSSFQLETTTTLEADAATVLNVSEDHLDRYPDLDAYASAKARIFHGNGVQVLNRDDVRSMGMTVPGRTPVTFGLNEAKSPGDWGIMREEDSVWLIQDGQRLMHADELLVTGLHNVGNALAALALCRAIDLPLAPLLDALRSFKGLPHRTEYVTEINGVIYYDDSKGTNVGASVAALQGLGRKAVLIAGGEGKEQDFSPLRPAVTQHARAVVLIGRDAGRIEAALQDCGVPLAHAHDMNDAVCQSARLAQPGDAVLLSPACASFDMFNNYQHRAEAFISAIKAVQKGVPCALHA